MKKKRIKQTFEKFYLINLKVTYFVCVNNAMKQGSWMN